MNESNASLLVTTPTVKCTRQKHGDLSYGRTTEYRTWEGIKRRCYNPKSTFYARYGGRGIKMCDSWFESYSNFLSDMGRKPSPKHTIDRIDNSLGYSKENCRWATKVEQNNNRSNNVMVTFNGKTQTVSQCVIETGLRRDTVYQRLEAGWSVEKAMTFPAQVDKPITFNGQTKYINQWAIEVGIKSRTISKRLESGWTIEEALTSRLYHRAHKL